MDEDKRYSNRELDHHFNDIREKFLGAIENIASDVSEIKIQTKLTNGRVGKLEKWQSYIQGGLTILAIIMVPILLMLISQYLN